MSLLGFDEFQQEMLAYGAGREAVQAASGTKAAD
jgi:hypothetical protein